MTQDLDLASGVVSEKTPNTFNYNGNVIISAPTGGSLVPFLTGGVGGLTMFSRETLGISDTDTFLTGNVGGGLKWYAPNGRWGLRGDYRFVAVRGKDDAPAFFGQETRYGLHSWESRARSCTCGFGSTSSFNPGKHLT